MEKLWKNSQWIAQALIAVATFRFFFWAYPYHLFHKEQVTLFLYNQVSIAEYFEHPAWLACMGGDFLTQFFYYIGGGPLILSIILTILGVLVFYATHPLLGIKIALLAMLLVATWEAGRLCGLAYPLSGTLALSGGLGIFLIYNRITSLHIKVMASIACVALAYWCFGYGAWACLALMIATELKAQRLKLTAALSAGILALPASIYPATSGWGTPDFDREYILSLDIENYFGNENWLDKMIRTDHRTNLGTYYYNLTNASKGTLSQNLMAYYQPATRGLFLPVNSSASYLSIQFANEVWYRLGDMTMAEHSAMLSMIFSPRHSGSRMIKRLAEINLINNDNEAAMKYLRILDKTLLHRDWARKRMPGQQTEAVQAWLKAKQATIPATDQLRKGEDVVTSLRHLVASNPRNKMAYEYLLCYHLLSKNIDGFVADYVPGKVSSPLYAEALLIDMARKGKMNVEDFKNYQIPPQTVSEFHTYTQLYEKNQGNGTTLQGKYGQTYWFYFHYATIKQQES